MGTDAHKYGMDLGNKVQQFIADLFRAIWAAIRKK